MLPIIRQGRHNFLLRCRLIYRDLSEGGEQAEVDAGIFIFLILAHGGEEFGVDAGREWRVAVVAQEVVGNGL